MKPPSAHGSIVRGSVGDRFTDGFEVRYLSGSQPATITSVKSVGASDVFKFLGAKIAGPTRRLASYSQLPGWPPDKAALGPLTPSTGAQILPRSQTRDGIGFELLIGYELLDASKMSTRTQIEIDYKVGARSFVYHTPATLTFCPQGTSDDTCLRAGSSSS